MYRYVGICMCICTHIYMCVCICKYIYPSTRFFTVLTPHSTESLDFANPDVIPEGEDSVLEEESFWTWEPVYSGTVKTWDPSSCTKVALGLIPRPPGLGQVIVLASCFVWGTPRNQPLTSHLPHVKATVRKANTRDLSRSRWVVRSDSFNLMFWLSPWMPFPLESTQVELLWWKQPENEMLSLLYNHRSIYTESGMNTHGVPYTYTRFHYLHLNFDSVGYEFIVSNLGKCTKY